MSLNISDKDNSLDLDLALEVAEYFRLNKDHAARIIKDVQKSVGRWRTDAASFGIPKSEQDRMARAFE